MIPADFKERVRNATDLVALIQRDGVVLKKVGGTEWSGLCPFHKEGSASFTVSESKQFYHCFGCNAHGDCFEWMKEKRGLEFMDGLRVLAQDAGIAWPSDAKYERMLYRPTFDVSERGSENGSEGSNRHENGPENGANDVSNPSHGMGHDAGSRPLTVRKSVLAKEKFRPLVPDSAAWAYLTAKRKIPASVLGEYRVVETHSKRAFYEDQEDWAAIGFVCADPMQQTREGKARVEFIKCLNIERERKVKEDGTVKFLKTEWRNPDSRRSILFGMDAVPKGTRELVICEGEMDALSWRAYGVWAVSVPTGAKAMGWIELCTPWLEPFDRIHLSFDEDAAGQSVVTEIAQRMGIERAGIVRLPLVAEGQQKRRKDANECLQAGVTVEAMQECLKNAEIITPERLKAIYDFEQEIWEKFHPSGRAQMGYTLPWGNSNDSSLPFRFRLGEVTCWSGHNGHGKSQVLNHCVVDLAWQGLRTLICSFEMAAPETYRRLIRMVRAEAKPAECAREEFRDRCLKPLSDKVWVFDHVGMAELSEVLDLAQYARRRYDVRVVVIDSLMCLKVMSEDNKYTEQKNFMNALCAFAALNQIHIVMVAHSKKLDVKGNKEHAIPRKYDIAGSADISNLAWNVIIVWRNKKKEERLRELWDECAVRANKSSFHMTAEDFDKHYTQEEKEEIQTLVGEKDAYFLVDKQRGGEGDEPVRNLWFNKSSLQYVEKPYHLGGRSVPYWQTPVVLEAAAAAEAAAVEEDEEVL